MDLLGMDITLASDYLLYIVPALSTLLAVVLGWCFLHRRRELEFCSSSSRPEPVGLDVKKHERTSTASELASIAEQDDLNNKWPIDEQEALNKMLVPMNQIVPVSSDPDVLREGPDPVEYCGHIQREIKKTKQRVALNQIESAMSKEQIAAERDIQRKQLEEIFRLLEGEKDKYGIQSVNDIEQQIKLYVQ